MSSRYVIDDMQVIDKVLDGIMLLEPTVHEDNRGSFFESFNKRTFTEITGFEGEFVQENQSTSVRHVLRGIHYQYPKSQGKLIRCLHGEIWDVVVDLRRSSPTFGEWCGFELTAGNRLQLWVPEGYGHGFLTLSETAQVAYKVTEFFDKECDRSIRWDDSDLAIAWPTDHEPIVSEKDATAPCLADAMLFP